MTNDPASVPVTPDADLRAVHELHEAKRLLVSEIEKRIVGQKEVVESLLVALFARGHSLFVGVPADEQAGEYAVNDLVVPDDHFADLGLYAVVRRPEVLGPRFH